MASAGNFTLDENEELLTIPVPIPVPAPSVVPIAQVLSPVPPTSRPTSPIPASLLSHGPSIGPRFHLRDPPKAQVDADLGVSNLAQAVAVLQENQKHIEDTEAQLQNLMRQHARLVAAGRLLEQQKVLDVLATGPELGYDYGRPTAALIVYRCCLRWSLFGGDAQSAAVLDHISALLVEATDEDAIVARTAAAARAAAGAGSSGGGAGSAGGATAEHDGLSELAAAAATHEVSYWLAVTSVLLALVDPHVPLAASPRAAEQPAAPHTSTPLAAVAGDARASMARAASAAAAKVHELQKRMGTTFSGMQLLGKNLLMRRRGSSAGPAAAATGVGSSGGGGSGGGKEADAGALQQHGGVEEGAAAESLVEDAHPPGAPQPHPPTSTAESPPPPPSARSAPTAAPPPPPSQSFRQQLDLLLQKTYNQMRDSLKRHVSAVLPGCVQQQPLMSPRSPQQQQQGEGEGQRTSSRGAEEEASADQGSSDACGAAGAPSLQSWLDLIAVLSQHLALMREAHVPRIIIRCLFKQTLAFADVQLFNQLLLRPECCCTSNARYLVAGLGLLDQWLAAPTPGAGSEGEDLALLAEDLRHIRQASHFLVLANKGALRLDDFTSMCPALNVQQLYRLATTFWDDSPVMPPQLASPPRSTDVGTAALDGAADAAAVAAAGSSVAGAEAAAAEGEGEGEQAAGTAADAKGAAEGEGEEGEVADMVGDAATVVLEAAAGDVAATEDAATAVMEAAAAAVAAAEAAAAADEAGDAPSAPASPPASPPPPAPPPPDAAAAAAAAAVSRNVSGEVLEEMKRRHSVANNGGLIVTFLLDEDSTPIIAPGGIISRQLLQLINEPRLHEGLHEGLPAALRSEDCPPQVFAFLTDTGITGPGAAAASEQGAAAAE